MQQKFTYLFIFLFLVSLGSISLAQNAPVDFEEGGHGATWTWTTFANGADTLEIVPNPDMTGLNTSSTVSGITALVTGDAWAGSFTDDIGEFTFDETNATVKIMVYKSVISDVAVKFEGASPAIEIKVANTLTDQWEELTFDFGTQVGNTFNRLVLFPDFTTRTTDNVVYMDNLTFSEGVAIPPVDVTFKVDMKQEASTGAFVAADHQVEVRGSFNGWDFGDNKFLEDPDGDLIYEVVVPSTPDATIFYKFFHTGGDAWESDPNREVAVAGDPVVLDPTYFNKRMGTGVATSVTFEVDMNVVAEGSFDPLTMPVKIAGSFTDWGTSAFDLADDDGDLVYSGTFTQDHAAADLLSGTELVFKFIYDDGSNLQWESEIVTTGDNNRYTYLEDGDNTFSALWNNTSGAEFADGNITFNVDLSVMTEVGVFDANSDKMQIRGGFNGWGDADPTISHMNQDFLDPNQWFIQIPFLGQQVGSQQVFKFFVDIDSASTPEKFNLWPDGYERPFVKGGGNRPALFEGTADQNLDPIFYDGVQPAYVIEEDGIEITFSIDMTVAADADQQVPTFDPAADTVWWVGEQPAFVYSQGWEDTDHMRVLALTDDDGDMIYTGTLTVNAPAWNGFEYRYGFSNTGDLNLETAGFGDFAYRVRYIEQDGYRSFVQPYAAPTDNWFLTENKQSEWEAAPAGDITGVEEISLVANEFLLGQNYPNPFNPSTQIRFAIPSSDVVTLKIYSLLGEEIRTLINEEMNSGTYEVDFDGSNLSSGLYFYTLTSGNFVSTKKMVLLK